MTNENENENLIETIDEDGNKTYFEIVDMITVDDIEYALLIPQCEDEECCEHDDEEEEILVMRVKRDGEEFTFEEIEDDEEFERVEKYVEQLEDEIDD